MMERRKKLCRSVGIVGTLFFLSAIAQAQTITVLHSFTGGADGSAPYAGVTLDRAGNLYGTTTAGANGNVGTVYKLSHVGSGWTLNTLYTFDHPDDPAFASGGVVFGPDGALYGASYYGGIENQGTVFSLRPPVTVCKSVSCPWTLTTIYSFTGGSDGKNPYLGNLTFDSAGNIYGTTGSGGAHNSGTVFQLTHSGSNWTESVLYSFTGGDDGGVPDNGVAFDSAGNLYGTAAYGGSFGSGTVYELSPSGSGWTESTLYSFTGGADGANPIGSVAVDSHTNLYGTTNTGGPGNAGTVWELTPSNGGWSFTRLHSFSGYQGPFDTPTLDAAGNVYGTSSFTGDGDGEVFKLTPTGSGWSYASYDFTNNGSIPIGGVTLDANGNLYGTTADGRSRGDGVVWEITP
ncbi:MAG: choice-of-anchor tandem repeat GloVer-containing protein [Candidatus Korobacteraceae bacterium]|jgi:uncharacterized repeat protein (TIGR03803 family)